MATREKYSDSALRIMTNHLYSMCSGDEADQKVALVPKGNQLWLSLEKTGAVQHTASSMTSKFRRYLHDQMHRIPAIRISKVLYIYHFLGTKFTDKGKRNEVIRHCSNYSIRWSEDGKVMSYDRKNVAADSDSENDGEDSQNSQNYSISDDSTVLMPPPPQPGSSGRRSPRFSSGTQAMMQRAAMIHARDPTAPLTDTPSSRRVSRPPPRDHAVAAATIDSPPNAMREDDDMMMQQAAAEMNSPRPKRRRLSRAAAAAASLAAAAESVDDGQGTAATAAPATRPSPLVGVTRRETTLAAMAQLQEPQAAVETEPDTDSSVRQKARRSIRFASQIRIRPIPKESAAAAAQTASLESVEQPREELQQLQQLQQEGEEDYSTALVEAEEVTEKREERKIALKLPRRKPQLDKVLEKENTRVNNKGNGARESYRLDTMERIGRIIEAREIPKQLAEIMARKCSIMMALHEMTTPLTDQEETRIVEKVAVKTKEILADALLDGTLFS